MIRARRPYGESRVAGGSREPTITTRGFVSTSRCQKRWVRTVIEVTTQILVMAWEYVIALTRCVRDVALTVCVSVALVPLRRPAPLCQSRNSATSAGRHRA